MKKILFSPINTNFMTLRYKTFVSVLLDSFEIVTNNTFVAKTFSHSNLTFIEFPNLIDEQIVKTELLNEFNQTKQLIQDFSDHFSNDNIYNLLGNSIDRSIIKSLTDYYQVKMIIKKTNIDFLIMAPQIENYLLKLCKEYNVLSIYLEHAPNLSFDYFSATHSLFGFDKKNHLFPDYVISDHSFSSKQWNQIFESEKNTQTEILELGIPLDTVSEPYVSELNKTQTITIGLFGTWIELKSVNSPIYNQILMYQT